MLERIIRTLADQRVGQRNVCRTVCETWCVQQSTLRVSGHERRSRILKRCVRPTFEGGQCDNAVALPLSRCTAAWAAAVPDVLPGALLGHVKLGEPKKPHEQPWCTLGGEPSVPRRPPQHPTKANGPASKGESLKL